MLGDGSKISRSEHCGALELGKPTCCSSVKGTDREGILILPEKLGKPQFTLKSYGFICSCSLVFERGSLASGVFDSVHLMYQRKLRFA